MPNSPLNRVTLPESVVGRLGGSGIGLPITLFVVVFITETVLPEALDTYIV